MPRKHLRLAAVAAIAALSAIGLAAAACDARPTRVAAGANLWVDTSGGRCTRSGRPAAYRDANACGSIDAAWDACKPGDTIKVRSGVYAEQTITGNKAAPGCTVRGERGTTIGALETAGAFFRLNSVTIDVGNAKLVGWRDRASNVALTDVRLHGPFVIVDIF